MAGATPMERRVAARRKRARDEDPTLLLFGDFVMSAAFVVIVVLVAEAAEALHLATQLPEFPLSLAITVAVLAALGPVCGAFGGALFNPAHCVAFAAAGKGTIALNAARAAAQAVGALLGAALAASYLPDFLQDQLHKLPGGLASGVSLAAGAGCEFALGAALNLVVLHAGSSDNRLVSQVLPLAATVALIVSGSYFSGPGLNPAVNFSWWLQRGHKSMEATAHALVYVAAPFAGALAGGLAWRALNGGAAAGGGAKRRAAARKARAE